MENKIFNLMRLNAIKSMSNSYSKKEINNKIFKIFLKIFKTNHTNEFKFKHSENKF